MRQRLPNIVFLCVASALTGCEPKKATEIVRGIYADPGAAVENRAWARYGAGYELDSAEKHGGGSAIRCANESDKDSRGASQTIRFYQGKPRPIVVAGWARLEGVEGKADYHCSVYLDLNLKDGKSWPMKIASFDPAKKGWQYTEQTYVPPAPVVSAHLLVFLRERKGTAWFDDIYVGEVLDDQGTRSKNLLTDPGFEGEQPGSVTPRDEFFGKLKELDCNAFHFYRSVAWETVMGDDPSKPPGALPAIAPNDPLLGFVRDAHRRGFKVWLTAGLGLPKIENTKSKEFPFRPCVNNRWGLGYTRALAYFAQYGIDGIGMVPDEWNYDNSAVTKWAKHANPEVAKFYSKIPSFCDCEACRKLFREGTGCDYPDVRHSWGASDPVWAQFTRFRYDSTAAWIRRSVEAVKRVNPRIVTDTMICVLPVCSDTRLHTGAAWDQIGVETGLDCLQTDPYIQLHNYLGDSTHYYTTETALHLTAANWRALSGVTLESCPLREDQRDKLPAEVYGAALSCLAHGATEFFWWNFAHLTGKVKYVDPKTASLRVAAAYKVMQAMEADVLSTRVPGELLVVYSRASEDAWDWLHNKTLGKSRNTVAPVDRRRGFIAHHNVLYWLLRRGYPFQVTFLDNPDPQRLKESKVLIVPFPFALKESEIQALEEQAKSGKTVILMSELSPVDEAGRALERPRLARFFFGVPTDGAEAAVGKGRIIFLGRDSAVGLFAEAKPVKGPKAVVSLPAFDEGRTAALEKAVTKTSLFAEQPAQDVEATLLEGPRGRLLLLINWDAAAAAKVALRPPAGTCRAEGFSITSDAAVQSVAADYAGERWTVELSPQEARLLKLIPITLTPRRNHDGR